MPSDFAAQRFEVVEEEGDVTAAEMQLRKRFQDAATWTGEKRLGYQGGNSEDTVWWVARDGVWMAGMEVESRWWNAFGTSYPERSDNLPITLEINIPRRGLDRQVAGAFLRDGMGQIHLAHSGRIGGGRKRIGKKEFMARFSGAVVEVDGFPYIVVGRLDTPDFITRVAQYVKVVEAFKQEATSAVQVEEDDDEVGNVWLFQSNPRRGFDLAEDVKQRQPGSTDWWVVTRHQAEMQESDRVVLWQAGDAAGIYGIGTLIGTPVEQDGDNPYTSGNKKSKWWQVEFKYDVLIDPPLTKAEIKADDVLKGLPVLLQPQATNYQVKPEQWKRLQQLLSNRSPTSLNEPAANVGYWKIAPGRGAQLWDQWRNGGFVSIGLNELGDLSNLTQSKFNERLEEALKLHADWKKKGCNQVWSFRNIPNGSRIVANNGTSLVVGIGTVIGPYSYNPDKDRTGKRQL